VAGADTGVSELCAGRGGGSRSFSTVVVVRAGGGVGVVVVVVVASQIPCHAATCDDGSCLMRCHRAFVSNSCHFFRTPLSLPWRHIQSLRDADQPVRRVPSRDGYPRRSARIVQRSVGDERPSSTAHLASLSGELFVLTHIRRDGPANTVRCQQKPQPDPVDSAVVTDRLE
jgi:hypothetical protein